ncbi:MAG: single-stranded DNA-binding protein, partial [Planctomycetota bacterium]|nr:single-stranded DNA-binding protein [Planctomycetota bacterium]
AKGRPLLVEGRLQFDTWEGKDGSRHSKHRVIVERFQFLGGGQQPRSAPQPAPSSPAEGPPPESPPPAEGPPTPPAEPGMEPDGENIPF